MERSHRVAREVMWWAMSMRKSGCGGMAVATSSEGIIIVERGESGDALRLSTESFAVLHRLVYEVCSQ